MVEAHPVVTEQRSIALTMSVGVTVCAGSESAGTALQRADEAMYLAKERGRNRCGDDSGRRSALGPRDHHQPACHVDHPGRIGAALRRGGRCRLPDPGGGGMGHKVGAARHNRLFHPAPGDASRQPHGSPHPSWRSQRRPRSSPPIRWYPARALCVASAVRPQGVSGHRGRGGACSRWRSGLFSAPTGQRPTAGLRHPARCHG